MSSALLISDAAKRVKVEAHVLRYWEEELGLPIKRNELGHRYYTEEDVKRFQATEVSGDNQGISVHETDRAFKRGQKSGERAECQTD